MTYDIALFALGVGALSSLLALLGHACIWIVLARPQRPGPTPRVSVLKPVKGLDEELFENLCSMAAQDYPDFEVLVGAQHPDDPALEVARQVQRLFPPGRVLIVAGHRNPGVNPKVGNLAMLSAHAKHDWLVVSDSNVNVRPGYLRALTSETRNPSVQLVSSVIAGVGEESLGALLENLQLASFVASSVCGAQLLAGHPCVVGKSMLIRRTALEALGGWRCVQDVLAEDYVLGQRFHQCGRNVALSPYAVAAVHHRRSLREFLARHLRWCQMRRRISPAAYCLEPLAYPGPWLLLALLLALASPAAASSAGVVATAALGLLLRAALEQLTLRRLRGSGAAWTDLVWSPAKDLLMLGVWGVGALRRTVLWRGQRLEIGPGSTLRRQRRQAELSARTA